MPPVADFFVAVGVLHAKQAVTRNGETSYPAPAETQNVQVVVPDISATLVAEEPTVGTMATNARTSFIVGFSDYYGPWTKRQLAIWGKSHDLRWRPEWSNISSRLLDGTMCGQAEGHEYKYSYVGYGYYQRQYNVGCTSSRVSVPWGDNRLPAAPVDHVDRRDGRHQAPLGRSTMEVGSDD